MSIILLLLVEDIIFYGHGNIVAKHTKTLEITKDNYLTKRGDCIIGISANKGCKDLDEKLKEYVKNGNEISVEIIVEPYLFKISAYGSHLLDLSHSHDIVVRKSSFISERTLAINSSAGASDIPRNIISNLTTQETKGIFRIYIER